MLLVWFVAITLYRDEDLADRSLRSRGFSVFLPRLTRAAPTPAVEIAFPGYLFLNASFPSQFPAASGARGVAGFISTGITKSPIPMPDKEMDLLIGRFGPTGMLVAPPRSRLNARCGDRVRMGSGPLEGLEAVVRGTKRERIKILFSMMGHATSATVPLDQVGCVV